MAARAEVLHWMPGDYLSDYKTKRLSLAEHGAYQLLLWHMWNDSDSQSEFPLDYMALGGIWGCCPEDAERICDSLTAGRVAVVKVVQRRHGAVLYSKRLHEQRKSFERARVAKSEAGKKSGRVRRANAANRCSTDVEQNVNEIELTVVPVTPYTTETPRESDARAADAMAEAFDEAWAAYPLHRFPKKARQVFEDAVAYGDVDPALIVAACKAAPRDTKQTLGFFISDGTYRDYIPRPKTAPRPPCTNPDCISGHIMTDDGVAAPCPDCRGGVS